MSPASVAGGFVSWLLIAIKKPKGDKIFQKSKDKFLTANERTAPIVLEWFHTHGRHLSAFQSNFTRKTGKFISWDDIKTRVEQGRLAFVGPSRGLEGVPVLSIWDADYGLIDACFYLYDASLEALGGSKGNLESEQEDVEIEKLGGDPFLSNVREGHEKRTAWDHTEHQGIFKAILK